MFIASSCEYGMLFISRNAEQTKQGLFNMTNKNIIGTVDLMNTGRAELYTHPVKPGIIEYHVFDNNNKMISFGFGTPRQAGSAIETTLTELV